MATKTIAWSTGSGNITLTYEGQGNGSISVESDENSDFEDRSQSFSIVTTDGTPEQAISILVTQKGKTYAVGETFKFGYTGSVQQVTLPKGKYKLQCWGAQGGSNSAASSYSITAKTGGKGGYSEGVLTLTKTTTLYIFVGGKGSSSGNGGWNGGGGGSGSSQYSYTSGSTSYFGITKSGGGGGATDISLVTSDMSYSSYRTNRSSASLLSRIIVAGGGSGGAMTYRSATTTSSSSTVIDSSYFTDGQYLQDDGSVTSNSYRACTGYISVNSSYTVSYQLSSSGTFTYLVAVYYNSSKQFISYVHGGQYYGYPTWNSSVPSNAAYVRFGTYSHANLNNLGNPIPQPVLSKSSTSTSASNDSQVGFAGGGTSGVGNRPGTQSSSGTLAGFGYGGSQPATDACHISGCGGGGWYGGGSAQADAYITQVKQSGGGSGFVNISANASYRPSGYTGLQLDSGTTTAGNTSHPSTSGGTETGHSGNGYAIITVVD